MATVVTAVFLSKISFTKKVLMAVGVQGIMPKKNRDVGFSCFSLFLAAKQFAAVHQMFEEFAGFFRVRHGADVIVVDGIRGQKIEENIRAL